MIQIRSDVFETNSSSAHTIAVKKQDEYDYDLSWYYHYDEDGKEDETTLDFRCFFHQDFGRSPFDILDTTARKLPYFVSTFGFKKMKKIILKCCPNIKHVIKKPAYSKWDDPDMKDGIDHQSYGMLEHFIEKNNLTIEEALFNNKYIIIIDGDEYDVWGKMINCGLINTNNLEDLGKNSYFDGDSYDTN